MTGDRPGLLIRLGLAAAALAAAGFIACDDGNGEEPLPTATEARPSPEATAPSRSTMVIGVEDQTPAGDAVEVTGIVGVVEEARGLIEITRLSGAQVQRIELTGETVIRRAGGGRIGLGEVQPSDRIIARGELSEDGDRLVAETVTVQELRPGASPGG